MSGFVSGRVAVRHKNFGGMLEPPHAADFSIPSDASLPAMRPSEASRIYFSVLT
jgi:hypothetical protein